MNPFKRIAARLNITVDSFLNQIENHEASIDCAIRDIRQAADRAKAQYHRVRVTSERMRKRIEDLKKEAELWKQRARKVHTEDEGKALDCVKRVTLAEREIAQLEKNVSENQELEVQLQKDLQRVDGQLVDLKNKRNTLASRQASAEALRMIGDVDSCSMSDVEDVFERWETKIGAMGTEGYTSAGAIDTLSTEFEKEEEKIRLQARLSEVLSQEKPE